MNYCIFSILAYNVERIFTFGNVKGSNVVDQAKSIPSGITDGWIARPADQIIIVICLKLANILGGRWA